MKYGLTVQVTDQISQVLARFPQVEKAILFGSRAKGTHKPGSDIDLAITGNKLDLRLLNAISIELDDLLLPYTFDLAIHHHIDNPELLRHIERAGQVFYQKTKPAAEKKALTG